MLESIPYAADEFYKALNQGDEKAIAKFTDTGSIEIRKAARLCREEFEKSNSLDVSSKAAGASQKKPALSNVQRAYNGIFQKPEKSIVDKDFFNACVVNGSLKNLAEEDISKSSWRKGYVYPSNNVFDVETKTLFVTMQTSRGKKLLESIDAEGHVKKYYDEQSVE